MQRYTPHVAGVLAVVGLISLTSHCAQSFSHPEGPSLAGLTSFGARNAPGGLNDVFNSTLGFQEVFVISLKQRADRQDAITVQASVTNLKFTLVDAARGDDISTLVLPPTMHLSGGPLGCWRSHLNVMRHVIENNIQTALIIEDDADWDVSLHNQLRGAAQGFRWLLNDKENTFSPYGDHWDLLWLGHEGIKPRDHPHPTADRARRWVVPEDPTVVPPNTRSTEYGPGMTFEPNMTQWEEGPNADLQTRIMFLSGMAIGSSSWAISLKGAEKILNKASLSPYNSPIDWGVGSMCNEKGSDMTCLASFPAIIGTSKPAGGADRGSDIATSGLKRYEAPTSRRTTFSTRLNLKRILNGETQYLSTNPNVTGPYMTMHQITNSKGYGWEDPGKSDQTQKSAEK